MSRVDNTYSLGFMYGMKRAEGHKGRVERAEGCKGWLKRAEGHKISGWDAAPLYFGLAGTL
jgi:hypothetical protein